MYKRANKGKSRKQFECERDGALHVVFLCVFSAFRREPYLEA